MTQPGSALVDQPERVFAVVVTYSERFHLVSRVIEAAFENGVEKVIVVANGAGSSSQARLTVLAEDSSGRVEVISLPENLGSAGGYKAGLERARNSAQCNFIWLLDDDNAPAEGALAPLLAHYEILRERHAPEDLALMTLREDRDDIPVTRIARGVPVRWAFPKPSCFMGVHLADLPYKFITRLLLKRPAGRKGAGDTPVKIPYGPYGGLFFHKSVIAKIGYPDERFFVYADDVEYTHRLTRSGGALYLVPSSVIKELDQVWYLKATGTSIFTRLLSAESDFRVYYATRNRVYFDRHLYRSLPILYTINKYFFLMVLKYFAIRRKKQDRFALLIRAIQDGENGLLGRQNDIESS